MRYDLMAFIEPITKELIYWYSFLSFPLWTLLVVLKMLHLFNGNSYSFSKMESMMAVNNMNLMKFKKDNGEILIQSIERIFVVIVVFLFIFVWISTFLHLFGINTSHRLGMDRIDSITYETRPELEPENELNFSDCGDLSRE